MQKFNAATRSALSEYYTDLFELEAENCAAEKAAAEATLHHFDEDELAKWKDIEDEAQRFLRNLDPSDPIYSDVYKDVYGVRPHW